MDVIKLLTDILDIHGICTIPCRPPYEDLRNFDHGLRETLISDFDINNIAEELNKAESGTIYYVEDNFYTQYIVFRITEDDAFYLVGPYLYSIPSEEEILRLAKSIGKDGSTDKLLRKYYTMLPCITDRSIVNGIMHVFSKYLFGSDSDYKYEQSGIDLNITVRAEYTPPAEPSISVVEIEQRYEKAELLMDAITQGDEHTALLLVEQFVRYRFEDRPADDIRYSKTFMYTLNVSARIAVQNAHVHPAHIHNVSNRFAVQIVEAASAQELNTLRQKMVIEYCTLSRRYSLRGYSAVVRKIIDYVDFHYMKHVSLGDVAKKLNYRPEYISSQFKKEKGITFVEYLNDKRLAQAKLHLANSMAPITEISENAGYMDINYFSRLFKKHYGVTPSEYRQREQRSK